MQETNNEIWKTIPSNERYEVSNLGSVRRAIAGRRTFKGRLLKCQSRGRCKPYRIVSLGVGSARGYKSQSVAELVLEAFVSPRPLEHEPDHINRNTLDDRLENLRWLPWRENRVGRPKGVKNGEGKNKGWKDYYNGGHS